MMNPITFGQRLLETNDIDPIYVVVYGAKLPKPELYRWLLAYWCFYHSGTASWITDQEDYWAAMKAAAASKEYPRCAERRHFRGEAAIKSVAWLSQHTVHGLFQPLRGEQSVGKLMKYVQTWVGFGPWIAFKVADMVERLEIGKVQFDSGAMFLFDSPKEGAERLAKQYKLKPNGSTIEERVVDWLITRFQGFKAPPRYERPVNSQEAETILCKWNSHMKGHYVVGEDIESLHKSLSWREGRTAKRLMTAGKGRLW